MSALSTNLLFYVLISSVLFVFGILAALTRKNAIGIFMGIELMLNAAGLNFVAFQSVKKASTAMGETLHGHVFSLFIIILAAIEAAVALAIVLRIFGVRRSIDPDQATELRG